MHRSHRLIVAIVAAGAAAAQLPPAVAEIVVLESTVVALKKGTRLEDNARIVVPDGRSVRLLLPSGATKRITGPYSGFASTTASTDFVPSLRKAAKGTISGGASDKGIGATPRIIGPEKGASKPVVVPRAPVVTPVQPRK